MAKTEKENFKQLIYELVASIPRGKVATYGQLAFLAGYPGRSRQVGHLLAAAPAIGSSITRDGRFPAGRSSERC